MKLHMTWSLLFAMLLFEAAAYGSPDPMQFLEFREPHKPGVLFTGTDIPAPPQQNKPWSPPASKFSAKWVSACQELVRNGFADPRGCEYREVELTCSSSLQGGNYLVTTHAWVIPLGQMIKLPPSVLR